MKNPLLYIHIISSLVTIFLTFILVLKGTIGITFKQPYKKANSLLSLTCLISFYLQGFIGIFLYSITATDNNLAADNAQDAMHEASSRFWSVEHLILMIFALIIAHIGHYVIKSHDNDTKKYKAQVIFYAISFLFITTSIACVYLETGRL